MVEEIVDKLINDALTCFDIPFCITANIATYLIIKSITEAKGENFLTIWQKRFVFLIVGFVIGTVYYCTGLDVKTIFNSIIVAPVSWSWLMKPICARLGIDYGDNNKLN